MRIDPFGRAGRTAAAPRRRGGGIRWWVLLLFAGYAAWQWFGSAQTDPYTGDQARYAGSAADDVQLGAQAYAQVVNDADAQGALLPADHPESRRVREIAQRLVARVDEVSADLAAAHGQQDPGHYRAFEWDVSVIESEEANAFCLPGGKMAVYTGLLPVAQTEDAVAVVMGHEIAHALLRHGSQRMAQQKLVQMGQLAAVIATGDMDPRQRAMTMAVLGAGAQYGLVLPYGREHETEADTIGLMLAAAACYDPREAIPLWERMSQLGGGQRPPEFASTHPDPANRIQRLQSLMPQAEQFRTTYCGGGAVGTP